MTTYMIHNNGDPVSIGTVIADPLQAGLTAVALSDVDATRLLSDGWRWNPATLAVDIEPPVDHGDGTGTRTTFHPDGTVDTVEQLTGLPIPPPPEPDPMADMQAQLAAQQALIDELLAALGGGGNG